MPRFGKDKNARNEELDRQAAEEVERLTRRGGQPGMGGMPGMGGAPRMGPPSPLEMMAAEVADAPPPSRRRAQPARKPAARPQQAFTPMPSGEVGSSFGPGGLNPGPAGGFAPPPPPAFGGGAYEEDFGGHVNGPPVYQAEPDEDEEMSITEMALMDHAARTGHNPEDLVMMYDASSAEEMRDRAMRQFYERQQSRPAGPARNDPFAPAGMRRGPAAGPGRRPEDPKAAGGALAQRLAERRRREEEAERRAAPPPAPEPAPAAAAAAAAAPATAAERKVAVDEGRLAQVLAKRRAALGLESPPEPAPADEPAPGRRHAAARAQSAPPLRAVPTLPDDEDDEPETPSPARATRNAPATKTPKAPAKKAPAARKSAAAKKAPATKKAAKAPAAAKAKKAGATLATPPPTKKKAAAKPTGKAKTVFCIECGEKNPAIAKFCFSCGNRLAVPEG